MTRLEAHERRAAYVPARVEAALNELMDGQMAAHRLGRSTVEERTVQLERLALLAAREAGWWGVLRRWTYSGEGLPCTQLIYGRAVAKAQLDARESAREWRRLAQQARALADRGGES